MPREASPSRTDRRGEQESRGIRGRVVRAVIKSIIMMRWWSGAELRKHAYGACWCDKCCRW